MPTSTEYFGGNFLVRMIFVLKGIQRWLFEIELIWLFTCTVKWLKL